MKQAPNQRRSRGRGNNSGGGSGNTGGNNGGGNGGGGNTGGARRNTRNQTYESNGPDIKVRGSAQQVLDKYLQLARDCQTGGDRVKAEAYLQFAEHYYRIVNIDQDGDQARPDRPQQAPDRQQASEHQPSGDRQQRHERPSSERTPSSERSEQPQIQQETQSEVQPERAREHVVHEQPSNEPAIVDQSASERPINDRPPRGRGRGRSVNIKNEATLAAEAAAANEAALKAGPPPAEIAEKPARRPARKPVVKPAKTESVEIEADGKPEIEIVSV